MREEKISIHPGDLVEVTFKVIEGGKERRQTFQGTVIRIRKGGIRSNFTLRKVSFGVGVERTFFFHSPLIEKIEVLRYGKVRRAKLYYLRKLSAKEARVKEKKVKIEG